MHDFQTPWPLFLGILAAYLLLSLAIGAKSVYFDKFNGKEEPKPETPTVPDVVTE